MWFFLSNISACLREIRRNFTAYFGMLITENITRDHNDKSFCDFNAIQLVRNWANKSIDESLSKFIVYHMIYLTKWRKMFGNVRICVAILNSAIQILKLRQKLRQQRIPLKTVVLGECYAIRRIWATNFRIATWNTDKNIRFGLSNECQSLM